MKQRSDKMESLRERSFEYKLPAIDRVVLASVSLVFALVFLGIVLGWWVPTGRHAWLRVPGVSLAALVLFLWVAAIHVSHIPISRRNVLRLPFGSSGVLVPRTLWGRLSHVSNGVAVRYSDVSLMELHHHVGASEYRLTIHFLERTRGSDIKKMFLFSRRKDKYRKSKSCVLSSRFGNMDQFVQFYELLVERCPTATIQGFDPRDVRRLAE